jgi:agmatine deiminase
VKAEGGGQRSVAGVDWQFNAWGGEEGGLYDSWVRDQAVAASILQARAVLVCRLAGSAADAQCCHIMLLHDVVKAAAAFEG